MGFKEDFKQQFNKRELARLYHELYKVDLYMYFPFLYDLLNLSTPDGRKKAKEIIDQEVNHTNSIVSKRLYEWAVKMSEYASKAKMRRINDVFEELTTGKSNESDIFVESVKLSLYDFLTQLLITVYNWLNSSVPFCCLLLYMFGDMPPIKKDVKKVILYIRSFINMIKSILSFMASNVNANALFNITSILDTLIMFIVSFVVMMISSIIQITLKFFMDTIFKTFGEFENRMPKYVEVCTPLHRIIDLIKRFIYGMFDSVNEMINEILRKINRGLLKSISLSEHINLQISINKWINVFDRLGDLMDKGDFLSLIEYCQSLYGPLFKNTEHGSESAEVIPDNIVNDMHPNKKPGINDVIELLNKMNTSSKLLNELMDKSLYIGDRHISYYVNYAKQVGLSPLDFVKFLYGNNYEEVLKRYVHNGIDIHDDIYSNFAIDAKSVKMTSMLKVVPCDKRHNMENLFDVIVKNIKRNLNSL